jgi:hypothetical protein
MLIKIKNIVSFKRILYWREAEQDGRLEVSSVWLHE